jgi:hypothetical protein
MREEYAEIQWLKVEDLNKSLLRCHKKQIKQIPRKIFRLNGMTL